MRSPNLGLLNTVIKEIDNNVFIWEQDSWVDSGFVAHPSELTECGTSYCVAGRIAAKSGREQLFDRVAWNYDDAGYPVEYRFGNSGFFLAREDDPEHHTVKSDGILIDELYSISDGVFKLIPHDTRLISAKNAAIVDLGIEGINYTSNPDYQEKYQPSVADSLFAGLNRLETIKQIRDNLVDRFGDNNE